MRLKNVSRTLRAIIVDFFEIHGTNNPTLARFLRMFQELLISLLDEVLRIFFRRTNSNF